MKRNPTGGLAAQLGRIKADLDAFADPESKSELLESLDRIISQIASLRAKLAEASLELKISVVAPPLAQVVEFLQSAKDDPALAALISEALQARPTKLPRAPIPVPPNLTNDQIREFLAQDLSKNELKAIAAQRGISASKRTDEEVRRNILRALERQEGYERLATPQV